MARQRASGINWANKFINLVISRIASQIKIRISGTLNLQSITLPAIGLDSELVGLSFDLAVLRLDDCIALGLDSDLVGESRISNKNPSKNAYKNAKNCCYFFNHLPLFLFLFLF